VEDGRTGVLVPPRDPGLLAEAILGRLTDPAGTNEMGDAGRRRAGDQFTVEGMVRQFEELYDFLLEWKR